jgi:hypothetical protein
MKTTYEKGDLDAIETKIRSTIALARKHPPNSVGTFVAVVRGLAELPGVSKTLALKIAAETFKGSYRAYCRSQERGDAPELFPDAERAKRLAAMVARGGRLI